MTSLPAAPFGRVLTAMVTAFHADGSVDLDGTARIAAHLVDHGHDGVVVCGTTGESPTTTRRRGRPDPAPRSRTRSATAPRSSPASAPTTPRTRVELAQQAEKVGADGLLLVTPYYNKPGQAGVLHHFRAVAEATDVPVMLYDIPGRTGTQIALETYERRDRLGHRSSRSRTPSATSPAGSGSSQLGYAVYSGDDVAQPRLARPRRPSASSPWSATSAGDQHRGDGRRVRRRRPRRGRSRSTAAAPRDRRHHGRRQLRSDHGQGRAPAARRARQPQRPARRSCPLDDDEVAALRAGLDAAGLVSRRNRYEPPAPRALRARPSCRRRACGSSRSAASARSAAT